MHDGEDGPVDEPIAPPAPPLKEEIMRSTSELWHVGQTMPLVSAPIFRRRANVAEQSLQVYSYMGMFSPRVQSLCKPSSIWRRPVRMV